MQTRARARSWGAVVAWSGGGEHHAPASVSQTPARRTPERTSSTCSALQLPLQLIEEPPVGSLRDDPIRVGLDHSCLPQAQGVEPPVHTLTHHSRLPQSQGEPSVARHLSPVWASTARSHLKLTLDLVE